MYWILKIYIIKQFREIIYTKFREMYRYLKNVHNETITQIIFTKFCKILQKKEEQNFAEFHKISRN
jgi:hypothetical protein